MTGLSSYRSDYVTQAARLTGAQRLYRGVELDTVQVYTQVYRQPRKLSSDLMPVHCSGGGHLRVRIVT